MQLHPARLAVLVFFVLPLAAAAQAPAKPPARVQGPATIDAQSIEGVAELEVTARGRVEFQREDLSVYSEFLRYNQEFGRIEADGGVRFLRGPDRFFGPRLRYDTRTDTGVFEQPRFQIGTEPVARGGAERLEFLGRNRMRMTKASFTTCEPGNDAWQIEAGELELDYEAEEGKARGMRLRLLDTTILALPYASFPLEKRRKTGFLVPYYSQNTRRGLETGIPFYWNIAPEYDLTLTPIYMSKRGEMLKSQLRYMDSNYSGQARFEYLPQDDVLKRQRSGYSVQHEHRPIPNMLVLADLNKVSDDRYLVDFASRVQTVSVGNLQRDVQMHYGNTFFNVPTSFFGRLQRFQTLQDPLAPIVSPYHRLPQLNISASKTELAGRFDLTMPAEYVRFVHGTLPEGTRTRFAPEISMPLLSPGMYFTPKLGLYSSSYNLIRSAPGQAIKPQVSVPWMSLDGGLTFERETKLFGQGLTQTLEPRLFYVYAPYRNQDQIPLFDTGLTDFNYAQLFTENRFAGGDRFGDANQLTAAVTSRFLAPGGQEILRATLGQRYYFSDERVGLTPTAPLRRRDQSDLLASVGGRLGQAWTADAAVQYNPQQSRSERYSVSARYAPEIAKVVSASYRFSRDLIRQVDLSGQWPLQPGWYAIGRYNYSFRDRRLLEAIAGLEYNAGCWVLRGVFQRMQAAAQTTSTAFFVQIEFNGLGQLGSDDTVDFLKRAISGYAPTNPSDPQLVPPSLRSRLPFEQVF
jgi:LPS-assembly protein